LERESPLRWGLRALDALIVPVPIAALKLLPLDRRLVDGAAVVAVARGRSSPAPRDGFRCRSRCCGIGRQPPWIRRALVALGLRRSIVRSLFPFP
jgi:hypothetical protein